MAKSAPLSSSISFSFVAISTRCWLTLLRLAAELSRDVVRIADSEKMLTIWLERENKPNEYKKHFKFASHSPDEEAVHTVYKFASKFGVHGHVTDAMFSEVIGTIGKSGSMLSLGVSSYGVLDAIHMWTMSFLPMHHICAKTFIPKYFGVRPEIFLTLRNHEAAMNTVIQNVSTYLENLKKPTKLV